MSADSVTLVDPSTPPPPTAAYFDPAKNAWVLSRYPDVWAALREPHLWPVSGKREIQPETRDDAGRLKQRADMLEALSASRLEAWRPRLESLTHRLRSTACPRTAPSTSSANSPCPGVWHWPCS